MKRLIWVMIVILVIISAKSLAEEKTKVDRSGDYFEIYLLSQTLVAYQDGQEVFREQISSGRRWHNKHWMRYKSVYYVFKIEGANARSIKHGKHGYNVNTPYKIYLTSVKNSKRQIGHVNIHGTRYKWSKVPSSRGCFREKIPPAKIVKKLAFIGMEARLKLAKAPAKPKV